jgi:hypothetical protein
MDSSDRWWSAALALRAPNNTDAVLGQIGGMSKPFVSDEVWAFVAPLLTLGPPEPKGGRASPTVPL